MRSYLMGVVLNLMWVKMLKYLTRHKAFSKLGRTIGMAAPTLAALTVFFAISILGYSIAYLLIIGVDNSECVPSCPASTLLVAMSHSAHVRIALSLHLVNYAVADGRLRLRASCPGQPSARPAAVLVLADPLPSHLP